MLFTSTCFLFLFLPIVVGGYFLMRGITARNAFLLLASLFFYSWGELAYCWVMLAVIAVNYASAILIERSEGHVQRSALLAVTVVADLAILIIFKYAGFFAGTANSALAGLKMPELQLGSIHLPLGISFFVFHSLSYTVDVYRRSAPAQRNPFNMALYIALFPQLVAGPIVRYHEIKDQLHERTHTVEKAAEGVRRFITGLGKKMLIANALAVPVDKIFALPANEVTMPIAWLAAICYTFQIYFDFSGYSDMAVGLALLFGFRLPENFNYPYAAKSMQDFWKRWHMSLSRWFRDYLYVPLGGNRCSQGRVCLNLVIVFFLCGLWHGASWQFVVWGLYHGFFLGIEKYGLGQVLERFWTPVRHAYVAMVVVLSWVLFRADSFPQAMQFYAAMFGFAPGLSTQHIELFLSRDIAVLLLIALVASLPIRHVANKIFERLATLRPFPIYSLQTTWVLAVLILSISEIAAGTYNPFIYFRF